MNAWVILAIFKNLQNTNSPTHESLMALADSANEETPSDNWNMLRDWNVQQDINHLKEWVKKILTAVVNSEDKEAVYFLLYDTELTEGLDGQDIYAYLSDKSLTSGTYEDWNKSSPLEESHNPAFHWIAKTRNDFMNINGFSDYAIPLLFSGAALYEVVSALINSREFNPTKEISIGVGYVYGDAFNLCKIHENKFMSNVDRLA